MREDFHKVVIERPRSGSRNTNRKTGWSINRAQYDRDDEYALPRRESSSWTLYGDKHFSDRLGPLRRYLEKQVGRPWNKVEGEFRKALDTRTVIGRHLWDHARHMVEREVLMSPGGRPFRLVWGRPVEGLYVHPRSGLLLRTKPTVTDEAAERRRRIQEAKEVDLDPGTRAERIGDLWYLFIDEGRTEEVVEVRKDQSGKMARFVTTRPVIRKKQASTREIGRIQAALERTLR